MRPSINKRVSVISIPNVKTAFKSLRKVGLNKNASLANLKTYTALENALEKMPENIPALNEFLEFLSSVQPKYEARPANKTINPTVVDKTL